MSETSKDPKSCELCLEKASKYCCPRCSILYCSLDCYKSEKHSDCSESFYRDCINDELSAHYTNDDSRNAMVDILKRLRESDLNEDEGETLGGVDDCVEEIDSDDNDEKDLHERMKNLDLDNADVVWEALTDDEKNEFVAILGKGDVGSLVPHWEPWWLYREDDQLVQDLNDAESSLDKALKNCPVVREVPSISSLTTITPSPLIKYNIVNVLASYAFIMRYFNGELEPLEGTTCILNVCMNLDQFSNFLDLSTSVESVSQRCLQSDLVYTDEESLSEMKRDTYLILQGPTKDNPSYYCKAALSHLYEIFYDYRKAIRAPKKETEVKTDSDDAKTSEFSKKFQDHDLSHLPKIDAEKIKKCIKKIDYYLSYIESFGMDFDAE